MKPFPKPNDKFDIRFSRLDRLRNHTFRVDGLLNSTDVKDWLKELKQLVQTINPYSAEELSKIGEILESIQPYLDHAEEIQRTVNVMINSCRKTK